MWTMYILQAPGGADQEVLVVDDDCLAVFYGPDPQEAATWLGTVGQTQVAVVTASGLEVHTVIKSALPRLPPQALARPRALLVPSREADLPIRGADQAVAAIARYRNRRLGRPRRRHRKKEGPYELAPA